MAMVPDGPLIFRAVVLTDTGRARRRSCTHRRSLPEEVLVATRESGGTRLSRMCKRTLGRVTNGAVVLQLRRSARPASSLTNVVCGVSGLSEKASKLGDTDANQTMCTTENEGGILRIVDGGRTTWLRLRTRYVPRYRVVDGHGA